MIIGSRIREAREALKLSQKEIAARLGMDPSQYSKIEKGKVMPTILQIIEICKIVKTTSDWLILGEENKVIQAPEDITSYKDQLELAKQNITLLNQVQSLKDKVHELEKENESLVSKATRLKGGYSLVAEPEPELGKKH